MKSEELYRHICLTLSQSHDPYEAKAMGRILIEDLLGMSVNKALAGIGPDLTPGQEAELDSALARLNNHEPLQYIIGHTTFCGARISVNPAVLIPRPETEKIVSIATGLFDSDQKPAVMDVCTGSGCIAIAIKRQQPNWNVSACDISASALQTATGNAVQNATDITFLQTDILTDSLPTAAYDLIVSNPPYVMNKEKSSMESNVLDFEPHLALFVDDSDPLVFYRAIASHANRSLRDGGYLLVEINSALGRESCELFGNHNLNNIELIQDCFGKDRFVLCRK